MEIRGISWIGLGAGDYAETMHFFSQTLGLEVRDEARAKEIGLLSAGSDQFFQVFGPRTAHQYVGACPVIAFNVDDVQAAYDDLVAKGVDVLCDVTSSHGFTLFYFRGPNGHIYAMMSVGNGGEEE